MRIILIFLFSLSSLLVFSQSKKLTVYLIPGMGTDHRVYNSFDLGSEVHEKALEWPKNAISMKGLKELAESLVSQIDTTEKFVLLGNSMGGMLSMELSQLIKPEAIILVSSIQSSKELPFRYKLGRVLPAYKLFGEKRLIKKADNPKTFKKVESAELRELYPLMLKDCGSDFLKWQMNAIVHWNFKDKNAKCPIFHIQGNKDRVLPLRKTKANFIISGGTHKLVANHRKDIVTQSRLFLKSQRLI